MTILQKINKVLSIGGTELVRKPHIKEDTSQFGTFKLIEEMIPNVKRGAEPEYIIDIGAADGIEASNTYHLYNRGFRGLLIEPDTEKFANLAKVHKNSAISLYRGYATPENILDIFRFFEVPKKPLFMSLDIDGMDYYVLEKILSGYRPTLICAEINENIPPPIKFTVTCHVSEDLIKKHLYGMSIASLGELCRKFKYDIIVLNYINAVIVPKERNTFNRSLTPEQAYAYGYMNQTFRKQKFPWDSDMEPLLDLPVSEGIDFINKKFSAYPNLYRVGV